LTKKFADRADQGEVHDAVFSAAIRHRGAWVTEFNPLLEQHTVQKRLRQLGPRQQIEVTAGAGLT
jgi:hypothetical protein